MKKVSIFLHTDMENALTLWYKIVVIYFYKVHSEKKVKLQNLYHTVFVNIHHGYKCV